MKTSASYIIGAILLLTSIGKAWRLTTDPFADLYLGFPVPLLWCSIIFELAIAVACFRHPKNTTVWVANTALFSLFFAVASTRMLLGYKTCGCGGIELPAYAFVILDALVVTALVLVAIKSCGGTRGMFLMVSQWANELGPIAKGRIAAAAVVGCMAGFLSLDVSQPIRAIMLNETPIRGTAELPDSARPKVPIEVAVSIVNRSPNTAQVVGFERSCTCVTRGKTAGKEIVGGQSTTLHLNVIPKKTGPFHQRVIYFVRHPDQFQVYVDVRGFVKKDDDES